MLWGAVDLIRNLDAVGDGLGATIGNIIDGSYKLMVVLKPDAVLVLGDTNSCLSVIGAKRLHIINLSDTDDLVTVMWANEIFDEKHPETYHENV